MGEKVDKVSGEGEVEDLGGFLVVAFLSCIIGSLDDPELTTF